MNQLKTQLQTPTDRKGRRLKDQIGNAISSFFLLNSCFLGLALSSLAALEFWPQPSQAAATEAWVHRFSNVVSNSVDRPLKIVRDATPAPRSSVTDAAQN
jgi:hypothetical protein